MKKRVIHLVSQLAGVAENEAVAGIYTIASLLFMMLVATSENLPLILFAVANLYLAVRILHRKEEK